MSRLRPLRLARLRALASALGAGATIGALAAPAASGPSGPPDPLDPAARVPPLAQRSALAAYRPLAERAPLGWREANEIVWRIGGWRAYLREAQQAPDPAAPPAPAAAPTPSPVAPAAPAVHGGHAER